MSDLPGQQLGSGRPGYRVGAAEGVDADAKELALGGAKELALGRPVAVRLVDHLLDVELAALRPNGVRRMQPLGILGWVLGDSRVCPRLPGRRSAGALARDSSQVAPPLKCFVCLVDHVSQCVATFDALRNRGHRAVDKARLHSCAIGS